MNRHTPARRLAPWPAAALLAALAAALWGCVNNDVKLHHVYIVAETEKVAPGDTLRLRLYAYPVGANVGFPNDTVRWRSSDPGVADIDNGGVVTAHRFGQATFYADFGPFRAEKTLTISRIINLPSSELQEYLLERFDTNHDGLLEGYETASTTGLDLSEMSKKVGAKSIDLTGIECFTNLQTLRAEGVSIIHMDLSELPNLRSLWMERCNVDTIVLTGNPLLESVQLRNCPRLRSVQFGSMEEHGTNQLRLFQCRSCDLQTLDLSRCGATLGNVECCDNPMLGALDLSRDTTIYTVQYSVFTDVKWPPIPESYYVAEVCQ